MNVGPAGYHLRWLVVPACQVSLRYDSHAIVRYEGVVVLVIPVNLSAVTQRTSSESIILSKWIGHCIKKNRDGAVDQGSQPRHRQPHEKYLGNSDERITREDTRCRGIGFALSTPHEEPAQTTIRDHITSTINQEGTSWHSKSTCS